MTAILSSHKNRYQGRWVEGEIPDSPEQFQHTLENSLGVWQRGGINVVWLPLNHSQAHLIAVATAQGFQFHHVSGDDIILSKRLKPQAIMPDFANHSIGVGGIVFNGNNEILSIVEKHDRDSRPNHWKFPGGMVDKGEFLRDAIVREVYEETGIHAHFERIVGMRHYHRGQFGTSNIYVVCGLRAISYDITPCTTEIAKAAWWDIPHYLDMPEVSTFNKTMLQNAIASQGLSECDIGTIHGVPADEYEIFL